MMQRIVAVAFVALAGCSPSSPPEAQGPCLSRFGSVYLATLNERSGTCGLRGAQVVVREPEEGTGAGTGCEGSDTLSPDRCEQTIALRCPTPGKPGFVTAQTGVVKWSRDGATGEGVLTVSLLDPVGVAQCTGTVDATYMRQ